MTGAGNEMLLMLNDVPCQLHHFGIDTRYFFKANQAGAEDQCDQ